MRTGKIMLLFLVTILLVLGLSISLQSLLAAAWIPPTDDPPEKNRPSPINAGPDDQAKQGPLTVATESAAVPQYGFIVGNGMSYFQKSVGIGSLFPNELLEVRSDDPAITSRIRIADYDTNPELQLQYGVGANNHWAIYNEQAGDKLNIWNETAGNALTVTQNGNVGINTADPQGKLVIAGNNNTSANIISTDETMWSRLAIAGGAKNVSLITLHTEGEIANNKKRWQIRALGNDFATGAEGLKNDFQIRYHDGAGTQLRLAINNEGNIGIGTSVPSARLHIDPQNWQLGLKITSGRDTMPFKITDYTDTEDLFKIDEYGNFYGSAVSSNSFNSGMEHNILFNAVYRYKVTQSGGTELFSSKELKGLFDGILSNNNIRKRPADPDLVITIEEGFFGQGWNNEHQIGWTSRYNYPRKFKIELWAQTTLGSQWVTVADVNGYKRKSFFTNIPNRTWGKADDDESCPKCEGYTKIRYTFSYGELNYNLWGEISDWMGISELVFIQPMNNRPYAGILPENLWQGENLNVGINTTSPMEDFTVTGKILATQDVCLRNGKCLDTSGSLPVANKGWILSSTGGGNWSATNSLFISPTGTIGIGMNEPAGTLHIRTAATEPNAEINLHTRPNNYWSIYHDRATEALRFWNNDASFEKNIFTIGNTGRIGIGTTAPAARLEIREFGAGDLFNISQSVSGDFFTVLNSGRVGVGTSTPMPGYRLAVGGKIVASGDICSNKGEFCLNSITASSLPNGSAGQMLRSGGGTNWDASSTLYISNRSFVGINTNAPVFNLQIGRNNDAGGSDLQQIKLGITGRYPTAGSFNHYSAIGLFGTSVDAASIYGQIGVETQKNFFLANISDAAYYNNNRLSIVQGGKERLTIGGYGNAGHIGVNKTNPTGMFQVNALEGTEGIRIVSASNWSPLNVRDSADSADMLRVDQSGNIFSATQPDSMLLAGKHLDSGTTNLQQVKLGLAARYNTVGASQYAVMGFFGTNVNKTDIYAQIGNEVRKNFFMGIFSESGYFSDNRFSIVQGGVERFTLKGYGNAGHIGINNTNPTAMLQVNAFSGNEGIRIVSASNWSPLNIQSSGGTDMFRVDQNGVAYSSGNIGVGTTTPEGRLEIAGNSYNSAMLRLSNTQNTTYNKNKQFSGIEFYSTDDNSKGIQAAIKAVHTRDTSAGAHSNSDAGLVLYTTTNFSNSTLADRIYINGGNAATRVGINTTTPENTLDVQGNIRAWNGVFKANDKDGITKTINVNTPTGACSIVITAGIVTSASGAGCP